MQDEWTKVVVKIMANFTNQRRKELKENNTIEKLGDIKLPDHFLLFDT